MATPCSPNVVAAFEELMATYNDVAVKAMKSREFPLDCAVPTGRRGFTYDGSAAELFTQALALLGRAERLALSPLPSRKLSTAAGTSDTATNDTRSRLLAVTLNNIACVYNEYAFGGWCAAGGGM